MYCRTLCFVIIITSLTLAQSMQQLYIKELSDYFKGMRELPVHDVKARKIYQNLVEYSQQQFPIYYVQNFTWGQAVYGGIILLDISIAAKDESILAFVMAHEWGHQALGHQANLYHPQGQRFSFNKGLTDDEDAADYYAGKFLKAYNYDLTKVVKWLKNIPRSSPWDNHSSGKDRANTITNAYNSESNLTQTQNRREIEYRDCTVCDGEGVKEKKVTCSRCRGDRVIICPGCRGNGGAFDYYGRWWACNVCGGRQAETCPECDGRGKIVEKISCVLCKGTGKRPK